MKEACGRGTSRRWVFVSTHLAGPALSDLTLQKTYLRTWLQSADYEAPTLEVLLW